MAERKVKIGGATFRRADGPDDSPLWGFALMGETVDVHKDDVARFDRLNAPAQPTAHLADPVPEPPAQPEPEGDEPEEPAGNASLETWQEFARARGASEDDIEGKSRNDLRDEFGN